MGVRIGGDKLHVYLSAGREHGPIDKIPDLRMQLGWSMEAYPAVCRTVPSGLRVSWLGGYVKAVVVRTFDVDWSRVAGIREAS